MEGNMIKTHIDEYKRELEQHQRAIIALTGAIQALERLQTETEKEAEDGADTRSAD